MLYMETTAKYNFRVFQRKSKNWLHYQCNPNLCPSQVTLCPSFRINIWSTLITMVRTGSHLSLSWNT